MRGRSSLWLPLAMTIFGDFLPISRGGREQPILSEPAIRNIQPLGRDLALFGPSSR
jgi:hypothetical protein